MTRTTQNTQGAVSREAQRRGAEHAPSARAEKSVSQASGAWQIARKTAASILNGTENAVYSPACIHEALRLIRLGASGATAAELDALLGTHTESGDWLGLAREKRWAYEDYLARLASGVWLDEHAKPAGAFLDACAQQAVPVTRADLRAPAAGAEITRWISEQTEGLLAPKIALSPLTLACVASALYLKDAWKEKFPKGATERKPFYCDGNAMDADFMVSHELELPFADTELGTLVGYPLSHGAMMVMLLPAEGLSLTQILENGSAIDALREFKRTPVNDGDDEWFARFHQLHQDGYDLDEIERLLEPTPVELHLPKFTCETTVQDMATALQRAGFVSANSPALVPMTGAENTPATYIHGAKIAIDEDGLEAGAYFVMGCTMGCPFEEMEPPKPRIIVLDRPFLYAVLSRTGQPLFVGTVTRTEVNPFAWFPCEAESEEDEIALCEEIPGICRITARVNDDESVCTTITCDIYGRMTHTVCDSDEESATGKYGQMKEELQKYAMRLDDETFCASDWCDEFVRRWQ